MKVCILSININVVSDKKKVTKEMKVRKKKNMEEFLFFAHWDYLPVNSSSSNTSITSCSHCIGGVLVHRLGGAPDNMPFGGCFYLLLLHAS